MMGSNEISYANETTRWEDRLSSLPDHILIDILSLLPIKSAIITSVLSHQWRYLWTEISSFNIIHNHEINDEIMFRIYDQLLNRLTSPSIYTLHLSFNGFPVTITSFIHSWFHQVCARNVERIKVSMLRTTLKLPSCIFETKSLVELDLEHVTSFLLPSVINLPNLKKLSIIKGFTSMPSINLFEDFLSCCSSLEDLYFDLPVKKETVICSEINLKLHNLKKLGMDLQSSRITIVIDAPNLEYFTVNGPMKFRFVQVPNSLIGTQLVQVPNLISESQLVQWKEDNNLVVIKFLESIVHRIRFLQLNFVPFGLQKRPSYLSCLKLSMSKAMDFKKMKKFLELCPALKFLKLRIDLRYSNCTNNDWRWKEWRLWRLPPLLNKIEIQGSWLFKHEKNVLNMVQYLVRSGNKELKQLTFGIDYDNYYSANYEKDLLKCLEKVRKVSNYEVDFSQRDYWSFIAWF